MEITTIFFFMNMLSGTGYSIFSPLFPSIAIKKGITETIIGFVISIFDLANTIVTAFTPLLCTKFTRIKLLYVTTFCEATCTILYGIIGHFTTSSHLLIILILISRIIHGLSNGIIATLLYSLTISLAKEEDQKKALAELEIGWCIGLALGPIIASVFYKIGGYPLPFFFLGLLLYTSLFLSTKVSHERTESNEEKKESPPILRFLGHIEILIILGAFFFGMISESFFYPSLTIHLENHFHLSLSISSLFFMVLAIVYIIFLLNIDIMTERLGLYGSSFIGLILASLGVLMVYPYPPIPKSIIFVIAGLGLIGGGSAPIFIPGFITLNKNIKKIAPEIEEHSANDISSAINNITIAIGDFSGPIIGGYFSTCFGFKNSCLIVSTIIFIYSILYFIYFKNNIISYKKNKKLPIDMDSKSEEEKELMNHPGFYKDDNINNFDLNLENIGKKKRSFNPVFKHKEDDDFQYLELTDKK